jgi:hypothetical protein
MAGDIAVKTFLFYISLHLTFVFFSINVKAEDEKIRWYQPELLATQSENLVDVLLSGKTKVKNEVRLLYDQIVLLNEKMEIASPPPKDQNFNELMTLNEMGIFTVKLRLPMASAQVPFAVKDASGKEEIFQLNFFVKAGKVIVSAKKPLLKRPEEIVKKWTIWVGAGINYLSYAQSSYWSDELAFESIDKPSLYFEVNYVVDQNMEFSLLGTKAPGKSRSSESLKFSQNDYAWLVSAIDMTYYLKTPEILKSDFASLRSGPRFGLQYHDKPYLLLDESIDNTIKFGTMKILMATLGWQVRIPLKGKTHFVGFMRNQFFLSSNDQNLSVKKQTAFDGSVGLQDEITKKIVYGLFWYGQYQRMIFNGSTMQSEKLLFSNIELRIGWKF